MQDILRNIPKENQKRKAQAFGLGLIMYISGIIIFINNDNQDLDTSMIFQMNPIVLLGIQGFISIFMFIGASALFISKVLKIPFSDFFPKISLTTVGLTILISVSFMVVNVAIEEWNRSLDFGDSGFAQWVNQSEEQLKAFTEHLTNFQSFKHFVLAFVVIAIIPAIGEELLFRGLIQNILGKVFHNYHVAIWITGFIFAAVHMQFYGVAPRMFLGVLFGYLYHWSGKLSIAMIGHLVNNGFALIVWYIAQYYETEVSLEQTGNSVPWQAVLIFAFITVYLTLVFYKRVKQNV